MCKSHILEPSAPHPIRELQLKESAGRFRKPALLGCYLPLQCESFLFPHHDFAFVDRLALLSNVSLIVDYPLMSGGLFLTGPLSCICIFGACTTDILDPDSWLLRSRSSIVWPPPRLSSWGCPEIVEHVPCHADCTRPVTVQRH